MGGGNSNLREYSNGVYDECSTGTGRTTSVRRVSTCPPFRRIARLEVTEDLDETTRGTKSTTESAAAATHAR